MRHWISAAVVVALAAGSAMAADDTPKLTLLKSIQTGSTGRWDYVCVDGAARRVYIPRSSHVQILDLDTEKVVGDVPNTNGVHGVALALEQSLGFASDGRDNAVTVFDLKTLAVKTTIKVGNNPDAITFDPASKHIMAFNHSGGSVSVIDPAALDKEPVTIQVGGTLETGVADGKGHVYVNVEDKNEIVEIDSAANRVLAHWPLGGGEGPTGLAIDTEHGRLFAGCANSIMSVLDSSNGKVLASVKIGQGVDGCAFDPALGAMSANGRDGTMSLIKETSPGKFEVVQTVTTISGVRTIGADTKAHRVYLPCNVTAGQFGLAVVGEAGK